MASSTKASNTMGKQHPASSIIRAQSNISSVVADILLTKAGRSWLEFEAVLTAATIGIGPRHGTLATFWTRRKGTGTRYDCGLGCSSTW